MVQVHLLPFPYFYHNPGDLTLFCYLVTNSPTLGTKKETIPQPKDSYLPQLFLYVQ